MTGPNGTGRVVILLAVHNGERFLTEQLESFRAQSYRHWDLVVGDDGSGDSGPDILRQFSRNVEPDGNRVTLTAGPCAGGTPNFLTLLKSTPVGADWVALSDQDDVWLPERLERGIAALSMVPPGQPALFGSASWIVDEALEGRIRSPEFRNPPGFGNALVQSIAGGNTMLLNRAAVDLVRDAAAEALAVGGPVTHDWWLYQIISGVGGQIVRDETPTILYRQHDGNLFGTNMGRRAMITRIRQILNGTLAGWISQNERALRASEHRLTAENRALLDRFAVLRTHHVGQRLRGPGHLGVTRQGRAGQMALWLACVLGRL